MLRKLDHKKKRILIYLSMIAFFFLAYQLSFKQTLAAISLHSELANQKPGEPLSNGGISQLRRKAAFYANVLKGYNVKKGDEDNRIWQAVSGMAMAKNVVIGFEAASASSVIDTSMSRPNLVQKHYSIKGEYRNLVAFLDTLGRSQNNGRLSVVMINIDESREEKVIAKLLMRISISAKKY